jgi:lysophospholipase L1-like esterase
LLFLGGVNDGNIGPTGTTTYQKQSMINIATLLTAWRTAGKVVFLANELPTGVGTAHRESYTIPAGGGTYTTLNASKYANDLYVSYTPAPGGANDGVKLTKVSSAPGAGQYSVSGGAYTFSAADGGATVAIDYTYNYYNNTGTGLIAKIALHNWLSSSAANFVDPSSGIDYGIPGALYNRSWVVPVDTWDTIADPTQASLALNLPNTLSDGLHPTDYGCQLIAKSFATALSSRLPQTDYSGLPTGESELVVTSNGVKTLYTSSDTSPLAHAFNRLPITPGTFTIQVGTTTVTDNGSGALSGTGVITASSTINYSTGAWSLGFTTAAKPAVSVKFIASTDPSTLITNGLLIPANGFSPVTSLSGCTGLCATSGNLTSSNNTGIPTGYIDSIDSGSSAGLGSGALKMDFALSTTTSDGYPELAVKVYGQTATSTSLSIGSGTTGATIQPNQKYRATAVVKIDAGPNGHLYGLTAVQLGVICTAGAGTSFTPAGETAVFSNGASSPIYTGRSWAAGTGVAFSDADVASGELRIPILSQSCDTTGMSGNLTGSISLSILGDPNTPISATIHISRLSLKPYSY